MINIDVRSTTIAAVGEVRSTKMPRVCELLEQVDYRQWTI